ncbi:hypothetical protein LCGC14_3149230, partial [marine sediment metagenome]
MQSCFRAVGVMLELTLFPHMTATSNNGLRVT